MYSLLFDYRKESFLVVLDLFHDRYELVGFGVGCLLVSELALVALKAVPKYLIASTDLRIAVGLTHGRAAKGADVFESEFIVATVPPLFLYCVQDWPNCRLQFVMPAVRIGS